MKARLNPFNSGRVERLPYRFLDGNEQQLLARLREMRFRGALVGPEGSGKTTLLELIASNLPGFGLEPVWIRLRRDEPAVLPLPTLGARQALLVDGADALPATRWLRLRYRARSAGGLLITSHRDGMLPALIHCRTTPGLLRELVASLAPSPASIEEVYSRHQGNIRNALRELYDTYAVISDF